MLPFLSFHTYIPAYFYVIRLILYPIGCSAFGDHSTCKDAGCEWCPNLIKESRCFPPNMIPDYACGSTGIGWSMFHTLHHLVFPSITYVFSIFPRNYTPFSLFLSYCEASHIPFFLFGLFTFLLYNNT
jgi:hypothetical protein